MLSIVGQVNDQGHTGISSEDVSVSVTCQTVQAYRWIADSRDQFTEDAETDCQCGAIAPVGCRAPCQERLAWVNDTMKLYRCHGNLTSTGFAACCGLFTFSFKQL